MEIRRELAFILIGILLGLFLIPASTLSLHTEITNSLGSLSLPVRSIMKYIHFFSALLCIFLFVKFKNPILLIIAGVLLGAWWLLFK